MNNTIDFDDYSKNYNKILKEQHKKYGDISYYGKHKMEILQKFFNSNEALNILEFGCGVGRNLPYLQKTFTNSTLFGFDISKESIKIAKAENPNVDFIEKTSFDKYQNFFDLIFISGVYHHIPLKDREFVTRQIHALTKNSGKVIVFEHNPFNPITMKLVNTCEFDKDAIVLKKTELVNLFTKNNFNCIKSNYTLFFPPKLKAFAFIEKYISWFFLGGQYYIVVEKK